MVKTIKPEEILNPKVERFIYPEERMCTTLERKVLASLVIKGFNDTYYSDERSALEFGTNQGYTSGTLSQAIKYYGDVHSLLYTVDMSSEIAKNIYKHQPNECLSASEIGAFYRSIRSCNVLQILKDSMEFDIEKDTNIVFLSFAFIDGCHSYEHTKHDGEEALKRMAKGSILALHNFNIHHKVDYNNLNAFVEDGPNAFTEQHDLDWHWVEGTVIVFAQI